MFENEHYFSCRQSLPFRCKKHEISFESQIFYIQQNTNQCPECKKYFISKAEIEIKDFITSLGFQAKKKRFGGYEWRDKQEICKSIIKNKLNLSIKLNARDFEIFEDLQKDKIKVFLNNNHLSGCTKMFVKSFSLCDEKGEIYSSLTLRYPFTKNKKNTIEIDRFCCKINTNIRGAFSRLFSRAVKWCKQTKIDKIITYSDCRLGGGDVYKNNNFNFIKHTGLNYFYTDFHTRFNRFKFRAQKGKSEKEIAEENNVYKIYDNGSYLWEYVI